jgi:hypothetical protein
MSKVVTLEVVPAAKANAKPAPVLKCGDDAANAKQLTKLYGDAQNGMRRVVALGLFAWELKELQLKHGEFGPWLAKHCPKLAAVDSVTGKARPSRAISGYMALTKNVLESSGFATISKYLSHISNVQTMHICHGGKFLLLPDKKIPADVKPLHEKICSLIDGKTQRQLFLEFKQAEEDDDGEAKVKRGRLKGKGGASKEQRADAKARAEQERIEDLELTTDETTKWLYEFADDKNGGRIDPAKFNKFAEAVQCAHDFCKRVQQARKQS